MDVIQVGGSSSSESEQSDSAVLVNENEAQSALYPNPNDGNAVFINLTDLQVDLVDIVVFDGLGRVVFQQQYAADGSLNAFVQFNQTLSSGIYLIEIRLGEEIITEKMIVD